MVAEKKVSYTDKPWLKSYKMGPYKLEHTLGLDSYKMPVYQILDDSAASYPNHVAIIFGRRKITYQELKLYTDKFATALADLGVKKGDRVAVFLPNSPQLIISEFGIFKAGGVYVPLSPWLKVPDLQHCLSSSGAEVIITLNQLLEIVNSIKGETKLREIIMTSLKDYTPDEAEIEEVPGTRNLRRLIAGYEAKPPEIEIDPMEDLAVLGFTGGATGIPKGVMRTHYNEIAMARGSTPWLLKPLEAGVKGKASLLIPMPLYHGAGSTISNSAFFMAVSLILMPDPRDTDAILAAIHEYRPFIIMAVPTQLMRLVQKKVGRLVSLIYAGAAPLPRETAALWKKETGMPAAQGYGITEGGGFSNLSEFSKLTGFMTSEKFGIGVPAPDLEVRLVDEETGEDVPVGEIGELWLRGPMVMKGYWPTPGSGLKDGWLATGDIARMDEDGYFYLEDRIKDMINVSGLKVYSPVVDDVLFKHPAVAMAVAIGIPDPQLPGSERVKAFIKLREGYEGKVTADDIIAHCRANLPPYAAPKFVEFREELPLTASEKLFKRTLREEEIAKMKARGEIK